MLFKGDDDLTMKHYIIFSAFTVKKNSLMYRGDPGDQICQYVFFNFLCYFSTSSIVHTPSKEVYQSKKKQRNFDADKDDVHVETLVASNSAIQFSFFHSFYFLYTYIFDDETQEP